MQDIVLHNTVLKCGDAYRVYTPDVWNRAFFRNNLFVGGIGGGTVGGYPTGPGRVLYLPQADTSTCSFDYDGYGSIGTGSFYGQIGDITFDSLVSLQSNTTEHHAIAVDLAIFGRTPEFPADPFPPKPMVDLRLTWGGAATDAGQVITGLNEEFRGVAPDLGAFEWGSDLPTYGPRL